MADRLLSLSGSSPARRVAKMIGVSLPPGLERDSGPWKEQSLAGRSVDVLLGASAALGAPLAAALARLGATVGVVGDSAPFQAAGEAWARPTLPEPTASPYGIVLDATGIRTVEELRFVYEALAPRLGRLARCGRVIFLNRPATGTATDQAIQWAIDGITRSLARELGRSGATANRIEVPPGCEDQLLPVLAFLMSPRSAYVSGQPWRMSGYLPSLFTPTRPLDGRLALVTGAARGIGAATARALAREGAKVYVHDHPSAKEAVEALVAELNGVPVLGDLATAEGRKVVIDVGPLDILVQNAGVTRDKTLGRMDPAHWDLVLSVNLSAVLELAEKVELRKGGAMVCLSSIGGIGGNVGQTNYAATKAGIIGLIEALAGPWSERGIAVSAVAPGFIETKMTEAIPFATREVARRLCNLSQGGQPEDIAEVLTFLASPSGRALSGRVLRVCGGNLLGA